MENETSSSWLPWLQLPLFVATAHFPVKPGHSVVLACQIIYLI